MPKIGPPSFLAPPGQKISSPGQNSGAALVGRLGQICMGTSPYRARRCGELPPLKKAADAAKQQLDDMQEDARKAGVPSSVRESSTGQQ